MAYRPDELGDIEGATPRQLDEATRAVRLLGEDVIEARVSRCGLSRLVIERQDRYQPVSYQARSKLLHALGFEQLSRAYVERAGADPVQVEAHLAYLRKIVPDPSVRVELYSTTQYVAKRPRVNRDASM